MNVTLLRSNRWHVSAIHVAIFTQLVKLCVSLLITKYYCSYCGPGSSVVIVTDYGLDGPGSNPSGDEIFRPSGPALGPTQPPVQWVLGLSPGVSAARACC
jgi:hypothetical protein